MLRDAIMYHLKHDFSFWIHTQDEPPEPGESVTLTIDDEPIRFTVAMVEINRNMVSLNPFNAVTSYAVRIAADHR